MEYTILSESLVNYAVQKADHYFVGKTDKCCLGPDITFFKKYEDAVEECKKYEGSNIVMVKICSVEF